MKQAIKTSFIALFLLATLVTNAQERRVKFGVKSGIALSNLNGYSSDTKMKSAYTGGLIFDYTFNNPSLFLSSGIEFTNKGANFDLVIEDIAVGARDTFLESNVCAMYIQVPLHFGYKIELSDAMRILVQAGPYAAYGVGGQTELGDKVRVERFQEPTVEMTLTQHGGLWGTKKSWETFSDIGFKKFDYGVGAAVTFEYEHVGLGVKYDFGLADISEGTDKVKNRNAYVTLNYKF